VFDPVAVRTQDNTLGDLSHNRLAGEAASDHICDIKVFFLSVGVVKFKGSVIGKPTPRASKGLLVCVKPQPQCSAAFIGFRPLAAFAPQPAVRLAVDNPTNVKRLLRLLGFAVLARQHGSSC
jgi:hypothetical protein